MRRRSGVTLLECLVAIFVMGIGLIALLTLFPIAALRMYVAIQSECTYQTGSNAMAIATLKGLPNDSVVLGTGYYKNPGIPGATNDAVSGSPSYPVFIDPVGWRTTPLGTPAQTWIGGGAPGGPAYIGRSSVSFVNNPAAGTSTQAGYQWFTRLDDIDFESALPGTGNSPPGTPRLLLPVPPAPQPVFTRSINYSYAFMCQRPNYADQTIVDVAVVVYNKRPLSMTGTLSLPEYVYPNSAFNIASSTIQINYGAGGVPPPVRVGDWVLDATPVTSGGNIVSAHAYFYRAVGVTDIGGNITEIETETPIRGFPINANAIPNNGTIVILDGVAEVYQRGTIRLQ